MWVVTMFPVPFSIKCVSIPILTLTTVPMGPMKTSFVNQNIAFEEIFRKEEFA